MKRELDDIEKDIRIKIQTVESNREQIDTISKKIQALDEQILAINVEINANSSNKMIEDSKRRIAELEKRIEEYKDYKNKLDEQIKILKEYAQCVQNIQYAFISGADLNILSSEDGKQIRGRL